MPYYFVQAMNFQNLKEVNRLFGYGLGYNFSVGNGVFSINYALQTNNGFTLTNGIVNFGMASYF